MFRITQDPSSGSGKLYLTEIVYNVSIVLVVQVLSVPLHPAHSTHTPQVQNMRPNTDNAHNNKYN
jgi:hypothetical protein